MRKTKTGISVAACLAASIAIAPAAFGQTIIYDNTSQFLGSRTQLGPNAEIGDIVNFAPGPDRILTEFAFEYFMSAGSGNETAQVFLRNVTDGTPGEVIYETSPFTITSGFNSVVLDGFSTQLPDTVAWTVRFSGFEGSEDVGLLFYNPATVGSNPTFNGTHFFISRNADGSFAILDTPGVTDNLGARFTAVPEPTTWALIIAGLTGFGLLRRRKS